MDKQRCMNCMKMIDANTLYCPCCGYEKAQIPFSFGLKQGTILRGRYLAGRVLGQGGFGITYVGYDLTLDIKVAIKEYFPLGCVNRNNTISNQVQWNTAQFDREKWRAGCDSFLKEARRMAKIDSLPGIVRVRDTFPENQTAYIVMDFIEGETLKQRLQKTGAMGIGDCIRLLWPFMESLDRVHRQGLIHRDISPDNIMIQPDGSVCLLDFGAAKDVSFHQTAASQQVAKKGFSPPEQYREKGNIGPWTDVYALCATIYYCVTGRLVPDAMDRLYEDALTFDMPLAEPLSENVISTLRDGLKLRSEERIQTVGKLLERLRGAVANGASTAAFERADTGEQPVSDQLQKSVQAAGSEIPRHAVGKRKFSKKIIGISVPVVAILLVITVIKAAVSSDTEETAGSADMLQQVQAEANEDIDNEMMSETTNAGQNVSDTKTQLSSPVVMDSDRQEGCNILMKDELDRGDRDIYDETVLGSGISRSDIASVTFLDTLDNAPRMAADQFAGAEKMQGAAWDVSEDRDGSVLAWIEQSAAGEGTYDLFIGAQGGVKGQDCTELFAEYVNAASIDFNNSFDTSQVTGMHAMFAECMELTQLDVSSFDTGNVVDMSSMFFGCINLAQLNVSSFDTGAVTDMSFMFYACTGLEALNVSSFDTGAVTDMCGMFYYCSGLEALDVSSFDTGAVTDMSYMFAGCGSLAKLNAGHFNVSSLETYTGMFEDSGITAQQAGFALVEYILPDSNSRYLTKDDLKGLSKEECRIARNEIFARHGRKFDDEELQAYFDSCSWYAGIVAPEDFDDSVLNTYEKANRDLIVEYEQEMGYR